MVKVQEIENARNHLHNCRVGKCKKWKMQGIENAMNGKE